MPYYVARGRIPHKRHTQFRKADGGLYHEELLGSEGFSGASTLAYRLNPPTRVQRMIPHNTTYQLLGHPGEEQRMVVIEAAGPIVPPRRYLNEYGQFLESSPYCERDLRPPDELDTHAERGEFEVRVKTGTRITSYVYDEHPFDIVGWDGSLYPYALNIEDFEPITGRVHQPPPVHQ